VLILTLFGLTLAARRRRGGGATSFGLALFICFLYMSVNSKVGPELGLKGILSPLAAAWAGTGVFGLLGFYSLSRSGR